MFAKGKKATYFDLESRPDLQRLQNPELMLGSLNGIVILDEIQIMPELFNVLRVLVDRPKNRTRFLILGSVSPGIIKNVSETLAGRVEFVELSGFDLKEAGAESWQKLWLRGGFPRSFLARSEGDSMAWREGFIRLSWNGISPVGSDSSLRRHASVLDDAGSLSRSNLECLGVSPVHGVI